MHLRAPSAGDIPLILDSFWRSYGESPYAAGCSAGYLRELLTGLITRPDWHTVVLVDDELDDEILGWCVFRNHAEIGWLYVKELYRRRGCAAALLDHVGVRKDAPIRCAFLTPRAISMANAAGLTVRFRPYLATQPISGRRDL